MYHTHIIFYLYTIEDEGVLFRILYLIAGVFKKQRQRLTGASQIYIFCNSSLYVLILLL